MRLPTLTQHILVGMMLGFMCLNSFGFGEAKGIDGFKIIDPSRYQVFSQRGKGFFEFMAQSNSRHSVCFFYGDKKPFSQLRNVVITMMTERGAEPLENFEIKQGCVEFIFTEQKNVPLQIEFGSLPH